MGPQSLTATVSSCEGMDTVGMGDASGADEMTESAAAAELMLMSKMRGSPRCERLFQSDPP